MQVMMSILGSGLFFTLYGIAGLFGMQRIHEKYKNHTWTPQYIRFQGGMYILLGAPWLILVACTWGKNISLLSFVLLALACGIPAFLYALAVDRKFKALLNESKE